MRTLIIDNGTYEIKLGWADKEKCTHVQNAMMRSRDRRIWLANAVDLCRDLTGLQYRRPMDRGQLYSWELQKAIWDWTWDSTDIVDTIDEFRNSCLLLTESPGSLPSSSGNTDQVIFEEYEFARYRRSPAQILAANASVHESEAKLVVDLGFHATHVVPVVHRVRGLANGIRRIDVGGKILTNYLKETVSYRHYNMMEETAIMGRIKERTCLVSSDFAADLETWHKAYENKKRSSFAVAYALPSTHEDPYGHIIPSVEEALQAQRSGDKQVLLLENERFSVPEALFDPKGHLGLDQAPLPETIASSIMASPEEYQPLLWSNIVVCGGTAKFANFESRLLAELRKWAPSDNPVRIQASADKNHSEAAWRGGVNLVTDDGFDLNSWTITREDYLENGPASVARRFAATNRWRPGKDA